MVSNFSFFIPPPPSEPNLIHSSFVAGLDKIEFLQSHEIKEIYQKSFFIIEQYFGSEEEDTRVAPSSDNNQYQFSTDQSVPMGGYQF